MTVTNDETGRTNVFARETPMQVMDVYETANERAEMLNGRVAMLGVIAGMGAYAMTGQILPGVW